MKPAVFFALLFALATFTAAEETTLAREVVEVDGAPTALATSADTLTEAASPFCLAECQTDYRRCMTMAHGDSFRSCVCRNRYAMCRARCSPGTARPFLENCWHPGP
ncbi:hypothetical protein QHF83_44580 [Polyangium sp. 15x6]|nr:hypothetical protein [Polyangium sp. 15x6]